MFWKKRVKENEIKSKYSAIVVGVSSGGLNALSTLMPMLEKDFALAVIVVMHLSPRSDSFLSKCLNDQCALPVKEADEKEPVTPGNVYLAPPNYHLLVELDRTFSLSTESRVNYARPSIDVCFESAAEAFGEELVGVVLTGANKDGSLGLKVIQDMGGLTIVQNPETAETPIMPQAALDVLTPDHILHLEEMGDVFNKLARGEHV